jgi:poly-gamma-glutamate capsule biosynthesis protein CapA/YwtB (metallophosphatase superfamily)
MGRTAVALIAVLALLAACDPAPGSAPGSASPPAPAVSLSAAPSSAVPSPAGEITLAFGGDVHFAGRNAVLLKNPATAFGPIASVLQSADLAMVNMETAITTRGTEEPKTFHFRAPPAALDAARAAGVDVVTFANNHVLDYGQVGLADTMDAARAASFPIVGIGRNATEAYTPWIANVRGVRIAFLAFSQIYMLASTWAARDDRPGVAMAFDLGRATAAVAAARQQADVVVVYNHWGQETNPCPTAEQRAFAAKLAEAGADVVLGAHAHVLQGDGWLGRSYVAYGLGNFVWYVNSRTTDTGVLKLTLQGRAVVKNEFIPAAVTDTGQPKPLSGAAAARLSQRFASLRSCTGLADRPS